MNTDPTSPAPARERLRALPPSAKLVAKVLETEGRLTQSGIAEETLLPPRTVRDALGRLEEADLISSRLSLVDARKRIYESHTDSAGSDDPRDTPVPSV